MSTAADIIKGSMRLIGAIAASETPSAGEYADGLLVLNDILESWANEGFMIYQKTREEFPLVAAQQTYTIGSGGNFSTTRPSHISAVGTESDDIETLIDIINEQQWAEISNKSATATVPTKVFFDGSFPLLNAKVWPIPTSTDNIVLYTQKPITAFASTATTVSLPPGYARALRYNLADEWAVEFGKQLDPKVSNIAIESKAAIMRKNTSPVLMIPDPTGAGTAKNFDINKGY